jgi:mRNA interferase HigB
LHVISRKKLLQAAVEHPELAGALDAWFRLVKKADWKSLEEVRELFPAADRVGKYTVFNVKGNNFRLIAEINYRGRRIYVRQLLTHAEYDTGRWKR